MEEVKLFQVGTIYHDRLYWNTLSVASGQSLSPSSETMNGIVDRGSKYSDEDRRRAVVEYAVHGVMATVSKSMGIPEKTLSDWKHQEWWSLISREVQAETDDLIAAQYAEIIRESNSALQDRIEHGDVSMVKNPKSGEADQPEYIELHTPVKARDLAVVGGIAVDKRQLIQNRPTSISANSGGLEALAEYFEKLGQANREKVVSEQ